MLIASIQKQTGPTLETPEDVRLGDGQMWMLQDPTAKLEQKEIRRLAIRIKAVAEQGEGVGLGDSHSQE